jgi:geranylgeranyl diphosphate synthase, type II
MTPRTASPPATAPDAGTDAWRDRGAAADTELRRILDAGTARARRIGGEHARLWAALTGATEGGKRFRPALVVAAHDLLGGSLPGPAARVGAAVELLHTAFVVHDDVIDGDDTRRGRPNVSGTFAEAATAAGATARGARTYADTAGILAGDLALVAAVRAVASCGAPDRTVERLLDLLDSTVHATAAGELTDVRLGLGLEDVPVSLGDVLTMSERKTAVYSFVLPLQAGALLAGAAEETVGRLGEIGRLVGIGFQLLDDLQGVFGDEAVTGKSVLTDLREGKLTPLIAHARSTDAWPGIAVHLGDPDLDETGADRVRALLVECGSRNVVEDLAVDYFGTAVTAARRAGLPEELLDGVTALTRDFLRRAA